MARVLALVDDLDGCALWRVLLPFTELQRQGYQGVEWGKKDDDRLANIVGNFEAVILPRLHWEPQEQVKADHWTAALHKAGLAVIYEMDDDMVSDSFVTRIMWKEAYSREYAENRRDSILRAIRLCDGVTVSSQRLATMIREYTDRPVKVVPNLIDLRWFKEVQDATKRSIGPLTIGWAGSFRPDSDIELMAIAWGRIAKRFPHVQFVITGRDLDIIYKHVPEKRIHQLSWMPIEKYPAGLVNIDIGCCALADTKFNRAKTFIKAMEYAASGAAVVASPTVYSQIVEHGKDGFIASTVDEWEEALAKFVGSYELRRQTNAALMAKIREHHSLEVNAWRWLDAWDSIIEDFRNRQRNRILVPKGADYAYA